MMMIAFVCGLAFGAVAAYFAVKTPIVINLAEHPAVKAAQRPEAAPEGVLACPNCGITSGRNGPFKSVKALHGHARACPKR
jgi:hypothetical protein